MSQVNQLCSTPSTTVRHIPFGLKDGRMVRVQEVATGLLCGCICPACGHALVAKAKESNFRRPHFAHYRDADCRTGFETSVHKTAKQLIAMQLRLCLPGWDGELDMPNPPMMMDSAGFQHLGRPVEYPPLSVELVSASLEVARGDYIPDITAMDADGELLIEIRVSHAVEALKRRRVQSEGVRMLEIDLSRLTLAQALDPDVFEKEVLENFKNRIWISCQAATDSWRASRDDLKAHVNQLNREIEAARALQEVKLAEIRRALEVKTQNIAVYREKLRRPYVKELAALPGLVTPNTIAHRLAEFERRDLDAITEGIGAIRNQLARALLAGYHSNAWVYGAHPILWQLGVYQHFIQSRESGYRFNHHDAVVWVRDRYGVDNCLYALFLAQYKARCQARNVGRNKQRISAWFLTELENSLIPNFYRPVNLLLNKFVRCGMLSDCNVGIGWVEVRK